MKKRESRRPARDKNFVGAARKVFAVLEALSQQPKSGLLLDEITEITGMAKTTVHRLLYSMGKLGYIEQDPVTTLYSLSGKFFELGTNALPYQRLTVLAKPLMQSLLLTFGESVNLAVPMSGVAIYILVLESPKPHRVAASVGNYSYLHATSVGKSIAAYMSSKELEHALVRYGMPTMTPTTITTRTRLEQELAKVRDEGVAVDNEENALGIICVGGPIFASEGEPIAALSISGPSIRVSPNLPSIKTAVREVVQKISLLLGHKVLPSPSPELERSEALTIAPLKAGTDLSGRHESEDL
jgi:IclR family acetate operon transcriptional repressor